MKIQYPFKISSSKKDKFWSELTPNQWNNMLPIHWTDNGFHIYKRMKERGPQEGINTPSDLESEINKGTVTASTRKADRFVITLSLVNSKGDHLQVIYDYDKTKKKCEMVTLSY